MGSIIVWTDASMVNISIHVITCIFSCERKNHKNVNVEHGCGCWNKKAMINNRKKKKNKNGIGSNLKMWTQKLNNQQEIILGISIGIYTYK